MQDSPFFHHSYEFKLSNIERKSNKCYFSGYATLFNIVDSYNDIISPNAFDHIKGKYVLLWQHNHSEPIGKITSMEKDEKGLYVSGELCLGIQKANDVYHMLKEDIIDSMSIGYTAEDYKYIKHDDGKLVRFIQTIKLWEISLVTFPAYEGAKVTNIKKQQYSDGDSNNIYEEDEESVIKNLDAIIQALRQDRN